MTTSNNDTLAAAAADTIEGATGTIIDGVDLSTLTTDQLLALSKEEWKEFLAVVEPAIKAKVAEEKAEFKAKLASFCSAVVSKWNSLGAPAVRWAILGAILLRVFGVI